MIALYFAYFKEKAKNVLLCQPSVLQTQSFGERERGCVMCMREIKKRNNFMTLPQFKQWNKS